MAIQPRIGLWPGRRHMQQLEIYFPRRTVFEATAHRNWQEQVSHITDNLLLSMHGQENTLSSSKNLYVKSAYIKCRLASRPKCHKYKSFNFTVIWKVR